MWIAKMWPYKNIIYIEYNMLIIFFYLFIKIKTVHYITFTYF